MMTYLTRFYRLLTAVILCTALYAYRFVSPTPIPVFSFTFSWDGLAFLMTCLAALVFAMFGVMSVLKSVTHFVTLLVIQFAITALFMSQDFISFYIFWELVVVAGFVLFYAYRESRHIQVFNRFLLFSFASSFGVLAVLLFCIDSTGFSLQFSSMQLLALTGITPWVFVLLLFSIAIKTPLFPLHSWQPDVYRDSDTQTTILFGALLSKMGILLLIRLVLPLTPWLLSSGWNYLGIGVGLVTLIYAGSLALIEGDLKRFLAFSSMSHLGLIVAAFFSGNDIGIHGAIFQIISHGILTLGLFWMVMVIQTNFGTTSISELSGLRHRSPLFAAFFLVFALASIGLPLTSGFVAEFLMILGLFKLNWIMSLIALFSVILSAWYMLTLVSRILYGEMSATVSEKPFQFGATHIVGLSFLILLMFTLGMFPNPILTIITQYLTSMGPLVSQIFSMNGVSICGL